MAVTTSALFDFYTGVLAKCRNNATLTSATYNVDVIDGPVLTDLSRPNILFVGAQPSVAPEGPASSGEFTQQWAELGARAKQEQMSVDCELWARTGATDLAGLRAIAKTLVAAIETDLRTDFTLSIAQILWCSIVSGAVIQQQTSQGASVAVPFTIAARARLASQ